MDPTIALHRIFDAMLENESNEEQPLNELTTIEPERVEPSNQMVPWTALMPQTFAEALDLSDRLSKSTLVPSSFRGRPGDIIVAIQWGAEIGLRPLQSLSSVAVINGRAGIYGDAALSLVWASGLCLSYDDCIEGNPDDITSWVGVARSWRYGTPAPIERRFSATDARQANLWTKTGPWKEYPRRMLIMRARGFLLRDLYSDVLRGMITVEELRDNPLQQLHVKRFPVEDLENRFNKTLELRQTDANPESLKTDTRSTHGQNQNQNSTISRPPPLKL